MITFETADQKEVRRFRIAQFNGRTATVKSSGSIITGHVRSVLANESSIPPSWTITIIPTQPKEKTIALRPALRMRPFAEDFC
jgi:hypothetical protein